MRTVICIVLFLHTTANLQAQYENVWAFGQNAGLDFNSGKPVAIKTAIQGFGEANASVCDKQGQLLFYTEGAIVWNKMGVVMPNGNDLVPVPSTDLTATTSSTQGALIVPVPGSATQFYIFSLTSLESRSSGRLYYSLIDMALNNGLGDVVQGKKGVFLDSNLTEKMTSTVGDQCNVWVLVRSRTQKLFKSYSVTAFGVNTVPKLSEAGFAVGNLVGCMTLSPNGKKLAVANCVFMGYTGDLELFDFDKITGIVSNGKVLDKSGYYGTAFSLDNSKLYASCVSPVNILQFDLDALEPDKTKMVVGASLYVGVKLAPDGKIYFRADNSYTSLSAINFPNLAGKACQFVPNVVELVPGTMGLGGMPNIVSVVTFDSAAPTYTRVAAPCWTNRELGFPVHPDTAGWNFRWEDGSTNPVRWINKTGEYWVSHYGYGCSYYVDTFDVIFPHGVLPQISIEKGCPGRNDNKAWAYTYPGDTVIYDYTWRNSAEQVLSNSDTLVKVGAGKYTLQVKTANCDTLLSFMIQEDDNQVSFSMDSLYCILDTLRFKNTSDAYYTQFQWSFGDNSFSTQQHPAHQYAQAKTYRVQLIGQGSRCSDTAYKDIVIDPYIQAYFETQPHQICAGETVILTTSEASGLTFMAWNFGDGSTTNEATETIIPHAFDHGGVMPIQLDLHFRVCPISSYRDTVRVYDVPVVDIGSDSSLCLHGAPLILKNQAVGTPDASYRYLWNTGETTASIKVRHPGLYSLRLSTGPLGCSSTETVEVEKDCYMDVPNAFTPNGDGYNDYFFPRQLLTKSVKQFELKIVDRWGQIVFHTTQVDGRGWDGTLNGRELPAGTYIYMVSVQFAGVQQQQMQGNVTLLR